MMLSESNSHTRQLAYFFYLMSCCTLTIIYFYLIFMIKSMTYYNKDVNINNKRQPSMIQLDYVTIKIAIIAKKKIP